MASTSVPVTTLRAAMVVGRGSAAFETIVALVDRLPAFILEVPVLTPYLSSLWLHLVTPVNAGVARPLIEGLRTETVARDDRIRELLPIDLTPFDVAASSAFDQPK